MSLLRQLFQIRGDPPPKPKTIGQLAEALRASQAAPKQTPESDTGPERGSAGSQGPCMDDPALPALSIRPTADTTPGTMVLGKPPEPQPITQQPAFIQVTPRPPRIAPLVTAPVLAQPRSAVRIYVTSDSAFDVEALVRHVASFPGVVECRPLPDDAHA